MPSIMFDVFGCVCTSPSPGNQSLQLTERLPARNKPAQLISAEVWGCFYKIVFFPPYFNMGAKQRKAHMVPANNKTCSKRNTKLHPPHLTKDIFDVIQNNVYLASVYHSFVHMLSLYAALIGVCVLLLGVCHREGRRQQTTANHIVYIGVCF